MSNITDKDYNQLLLNFRHQLSSLTAYIHQNHRIKIQQWNDEKEILKSFIQALSETKQLMTREIKKFQSQIAEQNKQLNEAEADYTQKKSIDADKTLDDLSEDAKRMSNKLCVLMTEIEEARSMISSEGGMKEQEQELWSTKLVVLQDTHRILEQELQRVQAILVAREKADRLARQKKEYEHIGYSEVARLQEQLMRTDAKLDRAKQYFHFPNVKGYKFRGGSGGIFIGAKDFNLAEVSGGFDLTVETVEHKQNEKIARVKVELGGHQTKYNYKFNRTDTKSSLELVRPTTSSTISSTVNYSSANLDRLSSSNVSNSAQREPQDQLQSSHNLQVKTTVDEQSNKEADYQKEVYSPKSQSSSSEVFGNSILNELGLNQVDTRFERKTKGKDMALSFLNAIGTEKQFLQPVGSVKKEGSLQKSSVESQSIQTQSLDLVGRYLGHQQEAAFQTSGTLRRGFTDNAKIAVQQGGRMAKSVGKIGRKMVKGTVKKFSRKYRTKQSDLRRTSDENLSENGCSSDQIEPRNSDTGTNSEDSHDVLEESDLQGEPDFNHDRHPSTIDETSSLQEEEDNGNIRSSESLKVRPSYQYQLESVSWDKTSEAGTNQSNEDVDVEDTSVQRQGVYIVIQASGVEVVGEKGTKVPNLTAAEVSLEVECKATAEFEYSQMSGWSTPQRIKVDVLHLRRSVRGNSLPLPQALISYLLTAILPKVIERSVLEHLPLEFGDYLVESGSGLHIGGDLTVVGPPLSVLFADLGLSAHYAVTGRGVDQKTKEFASTKEARALLGLSESQALALQELFCGRISLITARRRLSIIELCKYYNEFAHHTQVWSSICSVWDKAMQVVSRRLGSTTPVDFSFDELMTVAVKQLVLKPARVRLSVHGFQCDLNVDTALKQIKMYCERSAVEMHEKAAAGKGDPSIVASQPLDVQLKALENWFEWTQQHLNTFKGKFRSASLGLVVAADFDSFQVGAQNIKYDGPLSLEVPLGECREEDGCLSFEVELPQWEQKNPTGSFLEELRGLHKQGNTASNLQSQRISLESRNSGFLQTSDSKQQDNGFHKEGLEEIDEESDPEMDVSRQIGRLLVNQLRFSFQLDERQIVRLLGSEDGVLISTKVAGSLLSCLGDLFTASVGLRSGPSSTDVDKLQYYLKLQNGPATRLNLQIGGVGFESLVSPANAVLLAQAGIRTAAKHQYLNATKVPMLDRILENVRKYLTKETLNIGSYVQVAGRIDEVTGDLTVDCTGAEQKLSDSNQCILVVTNDIDLMTIIDSVRLAAEAS
eukprot:TRINITY_DN6444_c1_g1_i9.p1 TRINITY_DN6444_c1_g1~~TRINITY_DN6444_c1_g1_i9.p1  ORF type:complete len:1276 (+),score=187.54 TRINITY_DN6444_c1_g1_i9:169-3996(+)